jgi:preprotein translocase subunit YajC
MHPIFEAFTAQAAEGQAQSPLITFAPIILIVVVFYFLMIRPQQKQAKTHQTFLQGLKKGDSVLTNGGIIGEVAAVEDRTVTLNVGGGTKLRVLKAQVTSAWHEGQPADPKAAEKK